MLFILALVTCKGLLVYSSDVLGARLASRVSHIVRSLVFARILDIDHARLDRLANRSEAHAHFGLEAGRRTLLVFGGSQGARRINEAASVPTSAGGATGASRPSTSSA